MESRVDRQIEEALALLDGRPRAAPGPGFYGRVMERIDRRQQARSSALALRTAVACALLVALNIVVWVRFDRAERLYAAASLKQLTSQYFVNTVPTYQGLTDETH